MLYFIWSFKETENQDVVSVGNLLKEELSFNLPEDILDNGVVVNIPVITGETLYYNTKTKVAFYKEITPPQEESYEQRIAAMEEEISITRQTMEELLTVVIPSLLQA